MKHPARARVASYAVIAALIMLLSGSLWLKNQHAKAGVRRYLSAHQQAITVVGKNDFSPFDQAFYNSRVFLVGEEHAIRDTYAVTLALLSHIKKKTNFRYYLDELPYSSALDYNRYLDGGDESILKRAFDDAKGTFGWNRERFAFYQSIYRLNQALPPADRIRILGVDIEHQYGRGIEFLCDILSHSLYQKGQNPHLDELLLLTGQTKPVPEKVELLIGRITGDFKDRPDYYQQLLGDQLFVFRHVAVNIQNKFEANRQPGMDFNRFRDQKMFHNFTLLYSHFNLENEIFFGLWGRDHVYQAPHQGVRWFAHQLKTSSLSLKDKIASISIFYRNCQSLTPCHLGMCSCQPGHLFCVRMVSDRGKMVDQLARVSGREPMLFRLDAPASPFSRSLQLISPIQIFSNRGATTDYFQYAILIKDSPAASPLGF